MIIGLSGYARAGKDEAAKVLAEDYGFRRVAFADKLREVLYALDPIVHAKAGKNIMFHEDKEVVLWTVKEVIDVHGWDGYKESVFGDEIRRLLQRLGTEAGRQTLWNSIWVDAAFIDVHDGDNVVITDCRFSNEAQAVKERGGQVWRIERRNNQPAGQHISETALDDWNFDRTIYNNGSLVAFHDNVRTTYEGT